MKFMAIFGALLVAGCGQPELTDAQRKEIVEIAKRQAHSSAALESRMTDLETRLFSTETKNLELELEVNRLKQEFKENKEELGHLKELFP